jgi:hypothetical protein
MGMTHCLVSLQTPPKRAQNGGESLFEFESVNLYVLSRFMNLKWLLDVPVAIAGH